MDGTAKPTVASEIVLPPTELLLELAQLKTAAGSPVQVLCERLDPIFVLEHYGLPGEYPKEEGKSAKGRDVDAIASMLRAAAELVHAGTTLSGIDGAFVHPAFHCDEAHAVPGSLSWNRVPVEDRLRVVNAILRLSGFGGAAPAAFPAGG